MEKNLMPKGEPCKFGDVTCPCSDGDPCHYEGPNPMMPPAARKQASGNEKPMPTISATKRRTASEIKNLLGIAEAMSGVLYNMAQDDKVPEGWRNLANFWRQEWDAKK